LQTQNQSSAIKKENYIDLVSSLSYTHQKIIRFNIPMNKIFGMEKIKTVNLSLAKEYQLVG
jgi:hypothetical protein